MLAASAHRDIDFVLHGFEFGLNCQTHFVFYDTLSHIPLLADTIQFHHLGQLDGWLFTCSRSAQQS